MHFIASGSIAITYAEKENIPSEQVVAFVNAESK